MSEVRVLVVEDDLDGQEVLERMLRYYRIPMDMAASAEAALDLLATSDYTGAIIDLALPGIDGWTLLTRIQSDARTARLPCVAVTAYHSADVAVKAIRAGFAAYFPKPLEADSFVQELERVFNQ